MLVATHSHCCLYWRSPTAVSHICQEQHDKVNVVKMLTFAPGFSIFSDVALAVLPVPIIWKLRMPLKLRLYVVGILSLGYLSVLTIRHPLALLSG